MNHRTSRAWRALIPAALAVFLGSAHAAPREKPEFPRLELRERSGGQRAIELLGKRLPEVARWHRKSEREFAAILRRDRSARLDRRGRLHYVEDVIIAKAPLASGSAAPAAPSYPLDQTFLLHSRPGAQRTIYLDFNGHTAVNTAWNDGYGLATISSPPYDLDGVPYSFSQTELERIQAMSKRVAEDYAPFDVDITTEEPPASVLTRSSNNDVVFGSRVVITRDFVPGGCGCGGFAYVGVFDMVGDYYKPAYVFFDRLGGGNEKYVAEAISHEAGHNAGLNHDGTSSSAYYSGHGSGATSWAPIMGIGYYRSLVQWSKGEYAGANNFEDDFVVMQQNQLPLRFDDHGDTPAAASALSGGTTLSGAGMIERRDDRDVFKFSAGAGNASFTLSFGNPSPNLDGSLELLDAGGNVIAAADPTDSVGATLTALLPAPGTYYVRVDGVGRGAALGDGYSDYGSMGSYELGGSVPASSNQAPVALASATPSSGTAPLTVTLSGAASYDPDGSVVSWSWDLGDGSAPVSGKTVQRVYAQGSYTVKLTVADAQGLTDTRSLTINANPPVATPTVHVEDISIVINGSRRRSSATASVTIRDADGNPVPGATVSGDWSGVVSRSGTAVTNGAGVATIDSSRTRNSGSFTFSVTGVTQSGYTYSPEDNLETTDSASN